MDQNFGGCCAYRCTKICFGYDYVDDVIIITVEAIKNFFDNVVEIFDIY